MNNNWKESRQNWMKTTHPTTAHHQQQTSANSQWNRRQNVHSHLGRKGKGDLHGSVLPCSTEVSSEEEAGVGDNLIKASRARSRTQWEKYNSTKNQANITEPSIPGGSTFMVHKHRQRSSTHPQLGKSEDYSWVPTNSRKTSKIKQKSCPTPRAEEWISRRFYVLQGLWKTISYDLKRPCLLPSQRRVHTQERRWLANVHQETNFRRFKAPFFPLIAPNWNHPKCPLTKDKYIRVYSCSTARSPAISSIWINLTDTILSEKSIYYKVHKHAGRTVYLLGKHTHEANPSKKEWDKISGVGEGKVIWEEHGWGINSTAETLCA